ncbi:MAG: Rpn family recombination-promoting nuclease/putative transposase [Magnetococcus sp. THC-1_WYH]
MADHDGLYHQLYSHPRMMADLIRQFVNEPWVADLDLDHMEAIKSKFHVPGLPKRESDIIWRIPLRSGPDVYLLVLLEFQSEPDRWMVLRVLVYMSLLWLQLLHEGKIPASGPLPPLFPVVLHNGDRPWLTPVQLKDLIDLPEGSPLWHYQPDGRFLLIDEGRLPKKDLERQDSLSSLVFLVEQCANPEDLPRLAQAIIAWLEKHPEFSGLRQTLATVLLNAMTTLGGRVPPQEEDPIDLLEIPTMLQTRMEAWKEAWTSQKQQEWQLEWRKESEQVGEIRGELKGEMRALLHLLRKKLGPDLPSWVDHKLAGATLKEVETWIDRILDAQSLEDVFEC